MDCIDCDGGSCNCDDDSDCWCCGFIQLRVGTDRQESLVRLVSDRGLAGGPKRLFAADAAET